MTYNITRQQSDNGKDVYIYENNKRQIPLNSLYSPNKEAERYLKKIEEIKKSILIFIGFGNGVLLDELLKSKLYADNFHFIFIEPFSEVILSDSQTLFFKENSDKFSFFYSRNFTSLVFARYFAKYISVPVVIEMHPNYSKINDSSINNCLKLINEGVETVQVFKNTQAKFALDWILEPLLNIHSVTKSLNIKQLEGKFKGERAILIAAGPSLKEHVDFLKKEKDSFHLFAVGSALRALIENEVYPDYVLSMDASQTNYEAHFKGLKYNGTLIYETMSNSSIQSHHKGSLIVARTSSDYITPRFNNELYSFQQASPSVAILTLQVIAYLGFSEVYLVGQDLALVGGEYYAKGVKHHEGMANIKEELIVESNQGEKVGTTRALKIFLDSFEALIKKLPREMKIYNLSENGAKIEGTTFIRESEVVNGIKNNVEVSQELLKLSSDPDVSIRKVIGELKAMKHDVMESKKFISRLIKINVVNSNDKIKVVKDFRKVAKHAILEEVILSNLTFIFNSIINKIQLVDSKSNHMSKDYLELVKELENFYTLIVQYSDEIMKDERLTPYK